MVGIISRLLTSLLGKRKACFLSTLTNSNQPFRSQLAVGPERSEVERDLLFAYRNAGSIWVSQSGGLRISLGFEPSAGPAMPSRSIRSIWWAARP